MPTPRTTEALNVPEFIVNFRGTHVLGWFGRRGRGRWIAQRECSVLPRQGEDVVLDGKEFLVQYVSHVFDCGIVDTRVPTRATLVVLDTSSEYPSDAEFL